MMGFWFFITQYLQTVHGYTALQAGLGFLPMTVVNFIVAIRVPQLTKRYGNGLLLASGLAVTAIGMLWLSRLTASTDYLTGVALPMVLIGAGQGAALGPLTAAGIAGVTTKDAGAASGLVNVAHQLGGSLGLSVLVTVFAAAGATGLTANALLAHRVSVALTVGSGMLVLAFGLVVALIVRPAGARKSAAPRPTASWPTSRCSRTTSRAAQSAGPPRQQRGVRRKTF
jgi:sugar phosphate permease